MSELNQSERQPCEVWSRVMGYYRPVSSWNIGKLQEYKDRVLYKEPRDARQEEQRVS
jgi:anaerobic ribonucleoside-triphosphate reductase